MAVHRTPIVDERLLFAEYPFVPGAEALIATLAPSVGALFHDRAFDPARAAGRARVRAAIDDPTGVRAIPELEALKPDERFLSFQFARLLVSAAPSRAPVRRWAVAEAKSAGHRLLHAPDEVVVEVAHRLGYEFVVSKGEVGMTLPDYLKLATPIRESEFRLARQAVKAGRVEVSRARAVRLLEEGVRISLTEGVALAPSTRAAIEEREGPFLLEVGARLPAPAPRDRPGLGRLRPELFPPCIRSMRRTLEDGENLSHAGRFALASFLNRAGADFDTIVDAYRGAPDFDESVTRYQVEHITRKDEGRGYEPPDCATERTHGLCMREGDPAAHDPAARQRDPMCFADWLRHPLQYYRVRIDHLPKEAGGALGPPIPGPTPPRPEGAEGATGTPRPPGREPSTGPR